LTTIILSTLPGECYCNATIIQDRDVYLAVNIKYRHT